MKNVCYFHLGLSDCFLVKRVITGSQGEKKRLAASDTECIFKTTILVKHGINDSGTGATRKCRKGKTNEFFCIKNANGFKYANYLDIFVTPKTARRRGC